MVNTWSINYNILPASHEMTMHSILSILEEYTIVVKTLLYLSRKINLTINSHNNKYILLQNENYLPNYAVPLITRVKYVATV